MASLNWLEKGRKVWLKVDDTLQTMFKEAIVLDIIESKNQIKIQTGPPEARVVSKVSIDQVEKCTYDQNDVQDMVDLEQLSEAQLLYNVDRRYRKDLIFTYCGPTLLVVNPYKKVQNLFDYQSLIYYQLLTFTQNFQYKSNPPHIYALSSFALWQLFENSKNQSIVISGESGAGKTENTKFSLNFLASMSKNIKEVLKYQGQKQSKYNLTYLKRAEKALKKSQRGDSAFGIEERILGCNDILEGFGNAKTIRNDNSSRFGKLIILLYGDCQFDLKGAFISSYLLEKSRICTHSVGERNYHAFYYLFKGASKQYLQSLQLHKPINQYLYINQGATYEAGQRNDSQEFAKVNQDFLKMGFSMQEREGIWKIVAAVVQFGQLKFKSFLNDKNEEDLKILTEDELQRVCQILGVDQEALEKALTTKVRTIGGSTIVSPLKLDEANAIRDSFARCLYEKMFLFLVFKLNDSIKIDGKSDMQALVKEAGTRKSIGVLDIFGFQVLKLNSLEQVFINFANQKLQQLYVKYIFKEEKEVFLNQGLKQFAIDFAFEDNQPVIDLFQGQPVGLFYLLNEASEINKAESAIIQSIVKNHGKSQYIVMPKGKSQTFTIIHSCSAVNYNVTGFSQRNKDEVPPPIAAIFQTMHPVLNSIVCFETIKEQKQSARERFLSTKFLNEMNKLIEELNSCDCHFVRCIKTNSQKKPNYFVQRFALTNMRYLGVLDSIRIRKLGFIFRRNYRDFIRKFGQILHFKGLKDPFQNKTEQEYVALSRELINNYAPECEKNKDLLFGKQRILVKERGLNILEYKMKERKNYRMKMASRIQNYYRKFKFRMQVVRMFKMFRTLREQGLKYIKKIRERIMLQKVIKIQRVYRQILHRRRLKKNRQMQKKMVQRLRSNYRMTKQRRIYDNSRRLIVKIQRWWRSLKTKQFFGRLIFCRSILRLSIDRLWLQLLNKKATLIQKHFRAYIVRKQYKVVMERIKRQVYQAMLHKKAKIIQKTFKMFRVRKGFLFLRKAAMKIQAWCRGRWTRKVYLRVLKAVYTIQSLTRTFVLKKMFLKEVQVEFDDILGRQKAKAAEVKDKLVQKNVLNYLVLDAHFGVEHQSFVWWRYFTQAYQNLIAQCREEQVLNVSLTQGQCYFVTNRNRLFKIGFDPNADTKEKILFSWGALPEIEEFWPAKNPVIVSGDSLFSFQSLRWPIKQAQGYQQGRIQHFKEMGHRKLFVLDHTNIIQQREAYHKNKFLYSTFKFKQPVSSVSCSIQFCLILNQKGSVYGLGKNDMGQLGIEALQQARQPVLLQFFQKLGDPVDKISLGLQHSCCVTRLGKAFLWGSNLHGQLGRDRSEKIISKPTLFKHSKNPVKYLQVAAGSRCTVLLSDSLQIIWFGFNSKLKRQSQPNIVKMPNKSFFPVKISAAWNKTFSIVYCHYLSKDCTKALAEQFQHTCKDLAKNFSPNELLPYYNQSYQKILNLRDYRRQTKPKKVDLSGDTPFPFKMIDCLQGAQRNNFKEMVRVQLLKLRGRDPQSYTKEEKSFLDHLNNPMIKSMIKKM